MKFGVIYPNYGQYCTLETLESLAKLADSYFDCLLTWDHVLYPPNHNTFDAFSLLSFLACATTVTKLGTCVTPLPLYGAVRTAKLIASLDIISEGRAILGIGAGWYKKEFDAFGQWDKAAERVKSTRKGLQQVMSLLDRSHSIGSKTVVGFKCIQKPHPPIWIGSKRPGMIRIAAEFADGWIPSNMEPNEYRHQSHKIQAARKTLKIDSNFTLGYHLSGSSSRSTYGKKIEELLGAGCEFIAIYPDGGVGNYLKSVRFFGEDIIPSFS